MMRDTNVGSARSARLEVTAVRRVNRIRSTKTDVSRCYDARYQYPIAETRESRRGHASPRESDTFHQDRRIALL